MRRASVVLRNITFLAGIALPLATAAQTPAPPAPVTTGLILGRVIDAASGRPIGGAVVTLENVTMVMPAAPVAETRPRAMTNANGQFVFRRLEKGSFGITVTKPGYADGAYGRRRPLGSQRVVTDCYVILFSSDRTFWISQSRRILSARPASDASYTIRNIPPGHYLVAAVDDVEPGEWFDPAFLQRLVSAAAKISIADGEKKVQDITLGGG